MLLTKAERAFPMRTAKKAGGLRLCEIGGCCEFVLHALQFCNWTGSSKSVNKPRATFLLGTLRRAESAMSFQCNCFKHVQICPAHSCSLFPCLRFPGCATLVPLVPCTHRKKTTSKILGWNLTSPRAKVRAEARIKQQSRRQRHRPRALM